MTVFAWSKKIIDFEVGGPNPKGRPRLRWSDVISNDLKKKNINKDLASNRFLWKKAINGPPATLVTPGPPATGGAQCPPLNKKLNN